MSDETHTVFRFTADGVDLEFAGSEAFVEKQVLRFQKFLEGAVGIDEAIVAVESPDDEPESLESFYGSRSIREGRGAIQDRILVFVYYLLTHGGKSEVSGDDIHWCFQKLGLERPKNLHNALGILKRKQGYLQEGSRRGLYQLSPEGLSFVEGRFSATP